MKFKKVAVFLIIAIIAFGSFKLDKYAEHVSKNNIDIVTESADNTCLSCHKGIEHIRENSSEMMQEIFKLSDKAGFVGNSCIVCHGGNPKGDSKKAAHSGTVEYFKTHKGPKNFYPDPGSPWINEHSCGTCHQELVENQFTSLMFTEAGKIQGSLWSFAENDGYKHTVGNYDVVEKNVHDITGTDVYRKYMEELKTAEPNVFPSKMSTLPRAPTYEEVKLDPKKAVYTYLRQECQRCHTGNKGRNKRGDYRGMGCTSCHVPYSNEGFYEGGDLSINREEPGHLLVHSMQSTRKCKVKVHGKEYSGIPVETCTTCHDRGKRIGTSYQGIMETSYSSPFMGDGRNQDKLHSKNYLHLHADIHLDKGMLCQDCHTSNDVHSDGTLAGTTLAPVEIECQDCHGTPDMYPWELPLGYGDEVAVEAPRKGKPRGLAKNLEDYQKFGTVYNSMNGYLLSARGNALGNVVKKGNKIILHTAGGKDIEYSPLKTLLKEGKLSEDAKVAMVTVSKHIDKLECYACHSDWAPQCYGCHIKIDYSTGVKHTDWVAVGHSADESGLTADARGELDKEEYQIVGTVSESRSFLRWENPPLVQNGEGRISPAVPGCQTTITVIGKDGKPLLSNHIFKIPNVEGAGEEGQLAIDMSPTQPHTTSLKGRSCESCHTNPASMGYGIESGRLYGDPSKGYTAELSTADGEVLPKRYQKQVERIPNLEMDWSRFVTEQGKQLQTVGHHYKKSRPLTNEERNMLDRRGVCSSCHKSIPGDLAVSMLQHIKEVSGMKITTKKHSSLLNKNIRISAWVQIIAILLALFFSIRFVFRKLLGR